MFVVVGRPSPLAHGTDRPLCGSIAQSVSWQTVTHDAPQDIERKLNALVEDGRKPATVNRYRTLMSLVFSLAVRNGKLTTNPVRLVERRKENNERVRFLNRKKKPGLGQRFVSVARSTRPSST